MGELFSFDEILAEIQIKVEPLGWTPSTEILEEVEKIWKETKREKGERLFDNPFFTVTGFEKGEIKGSLVPYKWYNAQNVKKELYDVLQVKPLGVFGILFFQENFLLGKRASFVTTDPLFFEFAPSGGFDHTSLKEGKIDLLEQFYKELKEETNLSKENISQKKRFFLVQDNLKKSYDIAVYAELEGELPPLFSLEEEYETLLFASCEELKEGKITPLSALTSYLLHHKIHEIL